jgi:phage tail-like protein
MGFGDIANIASSVAINKAVNVVKKATGIRLDPYMGFNFLIQIDGLIAGGFSEVSGLDIETEVEAIKEGGLNDRVHQLPKGTKYQALVLKKGISDIDLLWNWYEDIVNGKIKRKSGSVVLLDNLGLPSVWWNFYEAFPSKWTGPSLNAGSNTVAVESLTITHEKLEKPMGAKITQIAGLAKNFF